jgi:hypothetical protein
MKSIYAPGRARPPQSCRSSARRGPLVVAAARPLGSGAAGDDASVTARRSVRRQRQSRLERREAAWPARSLGRLPLPASCAAGAPQAAARPRSQVGSCLGAPVEVGRARLRQAGSAPPCRDRCSRPARRVGGVAQLRGTAIRRGPLVGVVAVPRVPAPTATARAPRLATALRSARRRRRPRPERRHAARPSALARAPRRCGRAHRRRAAQRARPSWRAAPGAASPLGPEVPPPSGAPPTRR